jgi:transcriptional regulator with XRE-family HTH domain
MSGLHEQSRVVGQRIAAIRQRTGLSIRELAAHIGWPRDTLVNYELGRRAITIERLQVIAKALRVPAALLLLEDDQLAEVVGRLAADPALLSHVRFFLDTFHDNVPADPFVARGTV